MLAGRFCLVSSRSFVAAELIISWKLGCGILYCCLFLVRISMDQLIAGVLVSLWTCWSVDSIIEDVGFHYTYCWLKLVYVS